MSKSPRFDSEEFADKPVHSRRSWDPVVKLTHWSIVTAIIANALITEEGSGAHIWVGYSRNSSSAFALNSDVK